jgi:hypothetical protein
VNALSAGLVLVALPASLAIVYGGMFDVAAVMFGLLWVSVAADRARASGRRHPRRPAVKGWRLVVSAVFGLARMAGWILGAVAWSLAKDAGRGVPAVLRAARSAPLKLRRALNVRLRRARWNDAELAVLDNAEGLQWLLGGLPAARRERRLP